MRTTEVYYIAPTFNDCRMKFWTTLLESFPFFLYTVYINRLKKQNLKLKKKES